MCKGGFHMKVIMAYEELKEAAEIVRDTVGTDSIGHEGLRIYASKKTNRVKFTTTDGHYFTEHWISANVEEQGTMVVKAKKFLDYVKKLDVDKVTLKTKPNGTLEFKTKRGKPSFVSYSPDTFQTPSKFTSTFSIDLAGRVYKDLIHGVAFAADQDKNPTRPILQGIHISSNGKMLELATTNGLTVAHIRKKVKSKEMDVVLGRKSLVNSTKVIKDDDKVTLQGDDNNRFVLKVGDTTYYMPTLVGTFPNVKSILPGVDFPLEFIAEKDEFLGILGRASSMLNGKGILHFEAGKVTLSGQTEENDFSEYITTNLQGSASDIKVDVKKMTEIVKNMDADLVSIGVREKQPITIRPEGKKSHTCILAIG